MSNQTGARYLARKHKTDPRTEVVCTSHYKTEEVSIQVKDGVRKRVRVLKRKAE